MTVIPTLSVPFSLQGGSLVKRYGRRTPSPDNDPVEQNAREQIKERERKQKVARGCAIGCLIVLVVPILIVIIAIALSSSDADDSDSQPRSSSTQISKTLSADVKAAVVSSIKAYPEVRDAAITQKEDQLSLVLIVRSATNTQRAKELGENFVRLTKSLGPDKSPGKEIGKGTYDYVIGVYYPNEKQVALGAKSRGAERISW